jgi:hypothetical protein
LATVQSSRQQCTNDPSVSQSGQQATNSEALRKERESATQRAITRACNNRVRKTASVSVLGPVEVRRLRRLGFIMAGSPRRFR